MLYGAFRLQLCPDFILEFLCFHFNLILAAIDISLHLRKPVLHAVDFILHIHELLQGEIGALAHLLFLCGDGLAQLLLFPLQAFLQVIGIFVQFVTLFQIESAIVVVDLLALHLE